MNDIKQDEIATIEQDDEFQSLSAPKDVVNKELLSIGLITKEVSDNRVSGAADFFGKERKNEGNYVLAA